METRAMDVRAHMNRVKNTADVTTTRSLLICISDRYFLSRVVDIIVDPPYNKTPDR